MKDGPAVPLGTPTLLAISGDARHTGWAVFVKHELKETGLLSVPSALRRYPDRRAVFLVHLLEELAELWGVGVVACRRGPSIGVRPSGGPPPESALGSWRERWGLGWHSYTTREVRTCVEGRGNASRESLAHATMMALGLIGENKAMQEWEAAATGLCHIKRCTGNAPPATLHRQRCIGRVGAAGGDDGLAPG